MKLDTRALEGILYQGVHRYAAWEEGLRGGCPLPFAEEKLILILLKCKMAA